MTRRFASALVVASTLAILALASPGRAQDVTLDFEGLAGMNFVAGNPIPVASQLSDAFLSTYGVQFRSGAGYVAVVELGVSHATSGVNGIGGSTASGLLTYNAANPITATFFDPANPGVNAVTDLVSVRGDLLGITQSLTLYAYDVNGNLIGSDTQADTGGETFRIATPGIHSVKFVGTLQPDTDIGGVALDDFHFHTVTAVPESGCAAIAMAAASVGGLLLSRRRRRA